MYFGKFRAASKLSELKFRVTSHEERCKLALEHLKKTQRRVAAAHNRGILPVPSIVGDHVLCKEFPLSSAVDKRSAKLCSKWGGPWQIEKILTSITALLVNIDDATINRHAHVSQLKSIPPKSSLECSSTEKNHWDYNRPSQMECGSIVLACFERRVLGQYRHNITRWQDTRLMPRHTLWRNVTFKIVKILATDVQYSDAVCASLEVAALLLNCSIDWHGEEIWRDVYPVAEAGSFPRNAGDYSVKRVAVTNSSIERHTWYSRNVWLMRPSCRVGPVRAALQTVYLDYAMPYGGGEPKGESTAWGWLKLQSIMLLATRRRKHRRNQGKGSTEMEIDGDASRIIYVASPMFSIHSVLVFPPT
ncbi:unnamed protein product [Timema podura]|uniref:Uncharacterized protein n=1 Tax=Timema podura TaxID=61482 RepID=A0ABN7P3S9_TIMPD|nr:unnamed protein product [Timema podura]